MIMLMYTQHTQAQQMSMVMLDRVVDSENEDLMRRRAERELLSRGGVEVAEPYYHRHGDCETSTSGSYFGGSQGSITGSDLPGYFSGSQPPNEHYESSDYRVCPTGILEGTYLVSPYWRGHVWYHHTGGDMSGITTRQSC